MEQYVSCNNKTSHGGIKPMYKWMQRIISIHLNISQCKTNLTAGQNQRYRSKN